MISAGSVMIAGSVILFPGFCTFALFFTLPFIAVRVTGIVISGKLAFFGRESLLVQDISRGTLVSYVHVHPFPLADPGVYDTPGGSISFTVVIPLAIPRPLLLTLMI
jgi:hypothetical protein